MKKILIANYVKLLNNRFFTCNIQKMTLYLHYQIFEEEQSIEQLSRLYTLHFLIIHLSKKMQPL